MTQPNEIEMSEAVRTSLHKAVIDALLDYKQEQRERGLNAQDKGWWAFGKLHFQAMRRAAETLARFVGPSDD